MHSDISFFRIFKWSTPVEEDFKKSPANSKNFESSANYCPSSPWHDQLIMPKIIELNVPIILTDGPSHAVMVGNRQSILKRTTPRNMATAEMSFDIIAGALKIRQDLGAVFYHPRGTVFE